LFDFRSSAAQEMYLGDEQNSWTESLYKLFVHCLSFAHLLQKRCFQELSKILELNLYINNLFVSWSLNMKSVRMELKIHRNIWIQVLFALFIDNLFFHVVFLSKCSLQLSRILEYTSAVSYSFVVSPLIMWPVRNVTRSWAKYSNAIINYIVHLSEVDESPLYVSSSSNEVSWIAEYGFNKKGMLSHYFHSFLTRDYYWYFILRYIYSFSILLLEILDIIELTIYFFLHRKQLADVQVHKKQTFFFILSYS